MGKRGRRARRRRKAETDTVTPTQAPGEAGPTASVAPLSSRLKAPGTAWVRRHGAGRFVLTAYGPPEHAEAVQRALERAARVWAGYDRDQFWALLRDHGLTNDAIARIVETVAVDDEVYAVP